MFIAFAWDVIKKSELELHSYAMCMEMGVIIGYDQGVETQFNSTLKLNF